MARARVMPWMVSAAAHAALVAAVAWCAVGPRPRSVYETAARAVYETQQARAVYETQQARAVYETQQVDVVLAGGGGGGSSVRAVARRSGGVTRRGPAPTMTIAREVRDSGGHGNGGGSGHGSRGGDGSGIGHGLGLGRGPSDGAPIAPPPPAAIAPKKVSKARPPILVYPTRHRDEIPGQVFTAEIVVDTDGYVDGVRLTRRGASKHARDAEAAVWRFRYLPALDDDGRPIRARIDQRFMVEP